MNPKSTTCVVVYSIDEVSIYNVVDNIKLNQRWTCNYKQRQDLR